jgi:3-methyladenine DNA glycosylase/8-oxoguanine DNA glycosylase
VVTAAQRQWRVGTDVDVASTLSPLRRGRSDPTYRVSADGSVWWATRTADGPGTLQLVTRPKEGSVVGTAWGEGAIWLLERLPSLLGDGDDVSSFEPRDRVVARAWRDRRGWRMLRTERVFEACIAAVIEQKVTGQEARHSWRSLVTMFGEPAPGPVPVALYVPPTPSGWLHIPDWDFRRAGVTPQRVRTLRTVAHAASALERASRSSSADADRVLRALPGVGVWTSAETRQRSHGDADAVSFGDYHVSRDICWWLTGSPGDDERMRELLAPYRGHRYRVQRLMELAGAHMPRRGPRLAPPAHRFA